MKEGVNSQPSAHQGVSQTKTPLWIVSRYLLVIPSCKLSSSKSYRNLPQLLLFPPLKQPPHNIITKLVIIKHLSLFILLPQIHNLNEIIPQLCQW